MLLIDLDGVLIASTRHGTRTQQVIYPLHGNHTGQALTNSLETIAILTHRHKAEAEQILNLLGIDSTHIVRCYAAQDLWYCAIKYKRIFPTLRSGLRKSLILPLIRDELGYHPEDIALIDDRPEILSDMSNNRIGLTLLAPFQFDHPPDNAQTTTIDLSEALRVFEEWSQAVPTSKQHIRLKERAVLNKNLSPINNVVVCNRWDLFSFGRKTIRVIRRNIFKKFARP